MRPKAKITVTQHDAIGKTPPSNEPKSRYVYVVVKAKNTTEYPIGMEITGYRLNAIIRGGVDVDIVPERKG